VDNKQICPFCQQANQCGVNAAKGCWCLSQTIPPRLINLLPAKMQGKDCICAQCVDAFNLDPTAFKHKYQTFI
tara:strand:- start:309 stop:527 length:219 start_codon:yes stop_codon:yes gene_type:complete